MSLDNNISRETFRDEMQHRVVKHGPRSKPVREAIGFARRHEDPEFYHIAMEKTNAQKQYLRETYGPTPLERVVDFIRLGSPREILVTLILVFLVLFVFDSTESWMSDGPVQAFDELDVDVLAERMGLYMRDEAAGPAPELLDQQLSDRLGESIDKANIDQLLAGKVQAAMEESGIDELAVTQLAARLSSTDLEKLLTRKIEQALDGPGMAQFVVKEVQEQLQTANLQEVLLARLKDALAGADLDQKISDQIDRRLAEFDGQMAQRMESVNERVLASVDQALDAAGLKHRIAARVDEQLARFDEDLAQRISTALPPESAKSQVNDAVKELLVTDAFIDRLATAIKDRMEAKKSPGSEESHEPVEN
ncbi:hypothetical protein ACFL5Q_04210 [Planctomycetota bacterium]